MKKSQPRTSERKAPSAKSQPGQPQQQQYGGTGEGKQYGEGNYAATRQYNKGLEEHMRTHDIEREARDAAPRSADEAREMSEAERAGRSRAKGAPRAKDKP